VLRVGSLVVPGCEVLSFDPRPRAGGNSDTVSTLCGGVGVKPDSGNVRVGSLFFLAVWSLPVGTRKLPGGYSVSC